MNRFIGVGRLTKDPEITVTQQGLHIARFNVAIDRKTKEKQTDFIPCKAFGKTAEFIEKYIKKGTKIVAEGSIQTGSYKDKNDRTVYTTDVIIENVEFAESKASQAQPEPTTDMSEQEKQEFMQVTIDTELPF